MDILSYILSRQFTKQSLIGMGALKGSPCQVKNVVHQDGINTVTFEWEGTDGTTKTRDMVVYDGTPIYVWESGNTYHYGDLAIYESQFYRCIVENNDATFDSTKWNEIGSPDGNYDIVQSVNLLPARFTAADRKLYYVIDENCFYLWNGTAWVKTISNKIADLDDVNLDDLTEGDVLVWDSVNEKWVNKAKFDEYKTAFTGTEEEWDALTSEEQNVYDIMNITNDGDVLNLGIYLEKKTAMPVASEDVANRIYLYTGTTTQNYKKGVVYQCVSNGQTPTTYSWVALIDFGTAAIKNSTDRVLPNSTDLVESRAVYSAINTALSSIYTPRGNITCAELTSALLISDNIGNVYETSDSGTTSALFLQGAGHSIATGSNVGIINAGQGRILFNLMANAFDLTGYQKKDLTQAVEGETTVEGALGALSTNKQPKTLTTSVESQTTVEGALGALSTKKASKVSSATNGNFAGLDASGNLTDSGKKADDFATAEELADEAKTRAKLGAHNFVALNRSTYKPQYAANLSSITDQTEDSVTVTSIAADYAGLRLYNKIAPGEYIVSYDFESDDTSYVPAVSLYYSNSEMIPNGGNILKNTQRKITVLDSYDYVEIRLFITRTSDAVIRTGTFKNLMFRLATDSDATYQPYAKTNSQLTEDSVDWDNFSELGAVNMLDFTHASEVRKGYTFTNTDGVVTVTGSRASGETGNADHYVNITLTKGTYKVSGCPSGGSDDTWRLLVNINDGAKYAFDYGDGAVFTLTEESSLRVYCTIMANYSDTVNLTFYPMITVPSYNGDYVPYAKSNKELTEDVSSLYNKMQTLENKHKVTSFEVNTSGWSANTTIQSGVTLQKKSISLNHVYDDEPSVSIGSSSGAVLPTTAQQKAYNLLEYATINGTTLYLYASDVPLTSFYINVEGVD